MNQIRACGCDLIVHLPSRRNKAAATLSGKSASEETNTVGYCIGMKRLFAVSIMNALVQ
jgi:hypothetical protein